jgi:hypothetical protein
MKKHISRINNKQRKDNCILDLDKKEKEREKKTDVE